MCERETHLSLTIYMTFTFSITDISFLFHWGRSGCHGNHVWFHNKINSVSFCSYCLFEKFMPCFTVHLSQYSEQPRFWVFQQPTFMALAMFSNRQCTAVPVLNSCMWPSLMQRMQTNALPNTNAKQTRCKCGINEAQMRSK